MTEPERGWLTEDQQRIWRNYLLASTRVSEELDHALTRFNLSLPEYELLVRLSEAPGHTVRMGDLASSVRHSRSRLTHTAKRMESKGLLRRESCSRDGRGVQAVLTDEGMALLVRAAPTHVDSVRQCFVDAISPEDFEALGRAMCAVLNAADERTR
ncbi:MAG: MarR family transcriptional regulator [Tessaracoccus sp.]